MGKVTVKELPEDHPIFKAGWLITTVKKPISKDKKYEEEKVVKKNKFVNF